MPRDDAPEPALSPSGDFESSLATALEQALGKPGNGLSPNDSPAGRPVVYGPVFHVAGTPGTYQGLLAQPWGKERRYRAVEITFRPGFVPRQRVLLTQTINAYTFADAAREAAREMRQRGAHQVQDGGVHQQLFRGHERGTDYRQIPRHPPGNGRGTTLLQSAVYENGPY
jgi:hypothetical protein